MDECESGLKNVVKNQNIWELILEVNDKNVISEVLVRQGQETPSDISKKSLNYGKEKGLSCGNNMTNMKKIIKENEIDIKKNNNNVLVRKGMKQYQSQIRGSQPEILESKKEKIGFFGKLKNFFTRGKRGGKIDKKRKKETRKNINKYKKNITSNKKRNRNRAKKTYKKI